jgi:hypothetical protein
MGVTFTDRARGAPQGEGRTNYTGDQVSCSADSRLKTRRESTPCGVTSPRRACRKRGPSGDLIPETRVRPVVDTLLAGCIPASGAAVEAEQGPQFHVGDATRDQTQRDRPPPSIASEVRSPNTKRSGPLFRAPAIPAQRFTGPRHCQGLAPCLAPISRVFRLMMDCCQMDMRSAFKGSDVVPRISGTGH